MSPAPASDTAPIPSYDLTAPTEADALAALQRVFGPARGIDAWSLACRAAGVAAGRVAAGGLPRAVDALAAMGGASTTVARALTIRMRTYERLAARAANPGATR